MEIQGQIHVIYGTNKITDSFKKREIVIRTDEQYPQFILVQFVNDKCSYLDNYKLNDEVKVSINIQGREWISPQGETKYFNTINGWKIQSAQVVQTQNQYPVNSAVNLYENKQVFQPADNNDFSETTNEITHDDLPF
jgi:hypothetical protein